MQPYAGRHRAPTRPGRHRTILLASSVFALGIGVVGSKSSEADSRPAAMTTTVPGTAAATFVKAPQQLPVTPPRTAAQAPAVAKAPAKATPAKASPKQAAPQPAQPARKASARTTKVAPVKKATPVKKAAPTVSKATATATLARSGAPGVSGSATVSNVAAAGASTAKAAFSYTAPVTGTRISSPFGPRWGRMHSGVDFAGPRGTPLRAVGLGTVTFAGVQSGYGNIVIMTLHDGTEVRYAHMDKIAVKVGETIARGETIGTLGNTGRSTGPHLHFEVRPGGGKAVDPLPWLAERGVRF